MTLTYAPAAAADDSASKGGVWIPPRRIKRVTIEKPGPTLRELFAPSPRAPVVAPPLPEPVTAQEPPAESLSRESVAPDLAPLIDGLQSLRAALGAAALAQALEEDDIEVLMVAI